MICLIFSWPFARKSTLLWTLKSYSDSFSRPSIFTKIYRIQPFITFLGNSLRFIRNLFSKLGLEQLLNFQREPYFIFYCQKYGQSWFESKIKRFTSCLNANPFIPMDTGTFFHENFLFICNIVFSLHLLCRQFQMKHHHCN